MNTPSNAEAAVVELSPAPAATSTVNNIADLTAGGHVSPAHQKQLEIVANRFAVAVTPAMLDLIDPAAPDDPIRRQFVPDARELHSSVADVTDPIGDGSHSPLPGIVHRYPDRLLLTPIRICPVYCRFCFRRETVGHVDNGALSASELDAALDYIRTHDEIWEVILSGGDPLILSPRRLQQIIDALDEIEHVRVIRIHTRVPVVDPARVNKKLTQVLRVKTPVFVVLHSNHSREMTAAAKAACALLVDNGIPMLSQSVLLKGINDDAATLEQLLRTLVENRIKPYYLHHADRAPGTAHFRTTIAEGQQLMQELRGKVSGICQPEYVLDIPGGAGKVPAGPTWIEAESSVSYSVRGYQGDQHKYSDE
jgi:lysine 2,3-aminomutase